MSDSLNNKELVAVGHQFAKAISSDTPIMDIAKIVSRLAERLDCTTAALREMTKQRDADHADVLAWEKTMFKACGEDGLKSVAEKFAELQARCAALAAENAGLNKFIKDDCFIYTSDDSEPRDAYDFKPETPATDAFLVGTGRATVTLPNGYSVRPGHPINETERSVMIPKDGGAWLSRFDVEHALRVAGIRINRDE